MAESFVELMKGINLQIQEKEKLQGILMNLTNNVHLYSEENNRKLQAT